MSSVSILTTVTYYRIPRDEDGRPQHFFDRDFTMALRWDPFDGDPEHPEYVTGFNALKRLRDGDEVSQSHLDAAIGYLYAAFGLYAAKPPEPYPGRNDEAVSDLLGLLALLVRAADEQATR